MAKGVEIVLESPPKGAFKEGIISGTPLPGTKMEIKNAVLPVGGRHTWQAYGTNAGMATGDPRLCAILDIDYLQGKTCQDAYVSGTRGKMYCPLPGEEMNVLVKAQTGTGSLNAYTIGERLHAEAGSGQYIAQATSANEADFISMEHVSVPADTAGLVWVIKQ